MCYHNPCSGGWGPEQTGIIDIYYSRGQRIIQCVSTWGLPDRWLLCHFLSVLSYILSFSPFIQQHPHLMSYIAKDKIRYPSFSIILNHRSINQSLFVQHQFTTQVISNLNPNWASLNHSLWLVYLLRPNISPLSNNMVTVVRKKLTLE